MTLWSGLFCTVLCLSLVFLTALLIGCSHVFKLFSTTSWLMVNPIFLLVQKRGWDKVILCPLSFLLLAWSISLDICNNYNTNLTSIFTQSLRNWLSLIWCLQLTFLCFDELTQSLCISSLLLSSSFLGPRVWRQTWIRVISMLGGVYGLDKVAIIASINIPEGSFPSDILVCLSPPRSWCTTSVDLWLIRWWLELKFGLLSTSLMQEGYN